MTLLRFLGYAVTFMWGCVESIDLLFSWNVNTSWIGGCTLNNLIPQCSVAFLSIGSPGCIASFNSISSRLFSHISADSPHGCSLMFFYRHSPWLFVRLALVCFVLWISITEAHCWSPVPFVCSLALSSGINWLCLLPLISFNSQLVFHRISFKNPRFVYFDLTFLDFTGWDIRLFHWQMIYVL